MRIQNLGRRDGSQFLAIVSLLAFLSCTSSAFAPTAVRTFTVLSSPNDPSNRKNNDALVTKTHPTSDMSLASTTSSSGSSTASLTGESKTRPSTESTDNPFKVYELPPKTPPLVSIPSVASVFVATVGTFLINNYLNLGPIKASSIIALAASLVLPEKLALAALCGSFAGMAKLAVIPGGILASAVLGLLCAAALTLFDHKKWLIGMGGRLGFIAQTACTTQFIITSLLAGGATESAALVGRVASWPKVASQLPQVTTFTVVGALFMKYWKEFFAKKSPVHFQRLSTSVAAVGATGLVASFLLPASLAGPAFCGSFVTMSAPTKLPSLLSLIGASALAGLSQQAIAGIMLGGWGGRLGTAAFLGVLSYTLLTNAGSKPSPPAPAAEPAATIPTTAQPELLLAGTVNEQSTPDMVSVASSATGASSDSGNDVCVEDNEDKNTQENDLPDNLKRNHL